MAFNLAIVGATGTVGRAMINILAEREFPVGKLYPLASSKSVGKKITFGSQVLEVTNLDNFDFRNVDIALFSAGAHVSEQYAKIAAKSAVVIDNTSHFRTDPEIPLIVTEVNLEKLEEYKHANIISNPNCAVMQMLVALKPLHDAAKIKRIVVTTFQSVSGAGKKGMDELYDQTKQRLMADGLSKKIFPKQITFNILPHIGEFNEDGDTAEETKIIAETQKILDPNIKVSATCVRVPVFIGHSESVNVEFANPISAHEAREILENAEGVLVSDDPERMIGYTTPIETVGEDHVFVSRIREDKSAPNCLNLWIVSDNLRKGAALNAVQIAEELVKKYI
ncbi:MAG: aspartate-semialdehyde dehydrogenase [Candidatus Midichloriaceae bacterium]|jgi:aspartate-semialdehyde dehydrogenase|nr:aspartate-semialdehyde dehydrogenase [Candidatus Midichloriaceae bacterium]